MPIEPYLKSTVVLLQHLHIDDGEPFTLQDLFDLLPDGTSLANVYLTGAELKLSQVTLCSHGMPLNDDTPEGVEATHYFVELETEKEPE